MKKITSLLALLLLCSCFETPERECKDFKTGKFQFDYEVDGVKKTTTFIRTENQEIDFYEGKSDTSSIKWINDCEYVIQKINPKNIQEKKAISMKILSTTKDSYTFEFGIVGSPEKQTGTVKKIE
ncbi:MAG: DNA topoisomerase IV [Proteobacteria bacterium]|nr:MAG: DNA topoisomerase IV [Pseudomonadota bacterium]